MFMSSPPLLKVLPISVLEAMACGLPVIATGVGGVTDLLINGENGIVIPPHDPDSLSDCLLELLSNKGLRASLATRRVRMSLHTAQWIKLARRISSFTVT